jgi:hypothetical protein
VTFDSQIAGCAAAATVTGTNPGFATVRDLSGTVVTVSTFDPVPERRPQPVDGPVEVPNHPSL